MVPFLLRVGHPGRISLAVVLLRLRAFVWRFLCLISQKNDGDIVFKGSDPPFRLHHAFPREFVSHQRYVVY